MTYQEAYLDGFCKAAEAAGVDPIQLYKQAAPAQVGLIGKAVKGVERFGQLLKGGDKAIVGGYRAWQRAATRNAIDGLKSGRLGEALAHLRAKASARRYAYEAPELGSELRKVLLARLGVGTAAAGAVGLDAYRAYGRRAD